MLFKAGGLHSHTEQDGFHSYTKVEGFNLTQSQGASLLLNAGGLHLLNAEGLHSPNATHLSGVGSSFQILLRIPDIMMTRAPRMIPPELSIFIFMSASTMLLSDKYL
jgi:hypothetical protein